jgi:uncharacterized membrane protein
MTQDMFIQQLRHELRSLPKAAVDEIVADYREYIGDALAAGRSEADVIAALGSPAKLARELKAQATFRQWETRRSFGNLIRVFVSIAGLGLLQLLLLVPFMFYLLMLTIGYVVSSALVVGGLVTVTLLGSHHFFGWPAFNSIPLAPPQLESNAAMQGDPLAHIHVPDFKVTGERFELQPQPGTRISVVTTGGVIDIKNDDGDMKVDSVGGARDLFTVTGNTWSIQRSDVIALDLKNDEGDKVSVARLGSDPHAMAWDIADESGHMSFVEGGHNERLSVHSGGDSVVIDSNQISVRNDADKLLIIGPHGPSIGTLLYGIAMFIGGALGLWFCVALTRFTWRGLVRYVRRQIEVITQRLDEGHTA